MPLPLAVSGFSVFMAAKSLPNEVVEMTTCTLVLPAVVPVVDVFVELLQASSTRLMVSPMATMPILGPTRFMSFLSTCPHGPWARIRCVQADASPR